MNKNINKEIVTRFFIEAYNDKRYEIITEFFVPNYYDHSPAAARSAEEAIGILRIAHSIFPDIHVEIKDLIEENDTVAARVVFSGTHQGEYMGVQPTEKFIQWEALEIFRLENHKVIESWGYWPDLDIIKQLKESGSNPNL